MTMLLVNNPHELQHTHPFDFNHNRMPTTPSALSMLNLLSMGSPHHPDQSASPPPSMTTPTPTSSDSSSSSDNEVAQALEIARESPDGAKEPVISGILENALSQIWGHVEAQPDSYVMSRDEFAVFNYFQHRFVGNKVAVAARKRYWDNTVV